MKIYADFFLQAIFESVFEKTDLASVAKHTLHNYLICVKFLPLSKRTATETPYA